MIGRLGVAAISFAAVAWCQTAAEIVRKSVELDQANWVRMKDYTWIAHSNERQLDAKGAVKSEDRSAWETVIVYGEPHRKMIERHGKPLPESERAKEQQKLDRATEKLANESEDARGRRLAQEEKRREKEREFLREVPELYDLRIEKSDRIDGRDVWVIAAEPKPGYRPKRSDARPLMKIHGRIWIDKSEYQWVRIEAETMETISFGLFLARLNPGAKLVFEQARVNNELWLPKRMVTRGAGRLGLVKKLAIEEEITWSDYRKFRVESKIVGEQ